MKLIKTLWTLLATALLLAGCGGGSTLTGGGGGNSTLHQITVSANPTSVAADGSTSATVTATATDANNVALTGVVVSFGVSTGGVVTVTKGTTDSSGIATATVKASSATAGSTLTVTATSGGISGSTPVSVVAIQQTITLSTDSPQVPSDNSKVATISAQLTDANNNAMPGVTVHFTTTSGVLQVTQPVTDAAGIAKATVASGTDPTNRRIDVTASAGSATPVTVPVFVTGTTISLTGPANLVLGGFGVYQVQLTDASGKGISNRTVSFTSANGNTLSSAAVVTDGTGQASTTLTATNATTNGGVDTLTASALGLVATRQVAVSAQDFTITAPANGTKINLGASQTVTAHWTNGAAVSGATVSFSATRGTLSSATAVTNASGDASVTIASNNAGAAVVTATGTGVTAQVNVDFIATNPTQITLQATPASVAVQSQSTLTATVRDAANNLVEGQVVDFVLTDSTGGQLSVASAVTDAQGRAQTTYTAGNSTSAANGVQVTATVAGTAITSSATLTVGGQSVFLSLGTGNTIETPDAASYAVPYAILALDSQGAVMPNAPITLRVLPVSYAKGYRVWNDAAGHWDTLVTTLPGEASCANEDTDFSGNINSLGTDAAAGRCPNAPYGPAVKPPAKDYNCSATLDPGNVAGVTPSSGVTGSDGKLLVKVVYPRSYAYYEEVTLTVTTTVQGTQGSTSATFWLPGASADFNTKTTAPPGPTSPWGVGTACTDPH